MWYSNCNGEILGYDRDTTNKELRIGRIECVCIYIYDIVTVDKNEDQVPMQRIYCIDFHPGLLVLFRI